MAISEWITPLDTVQTNTFALKLVLLVTSFQAFLVARRSVMQNVGHRCYSFSADGAGAEQNDKQLS